MAEYKLIDTKGFANIKDLGTVSIQSNDEGKYFLQLVISNTKYCLKTTRGSPKLFTSLEAVFKFLRLQKITDVDVSNLLTN